MSICYISLMTMHLSSSWPKIDSRTCYILRCYKHTIRPMLTNIVTNTRNTTRSTYLPSPFSCNPHAWQILNIVYMCLFGLSIWRNNWTIHIGIPNDRIELQFINHTLVTYHWTPSSLHYCHQVTFILHEFTLSSTIKSKRESILELLTYWFNH